MQTILQTVEEINQIFSNVGEQQIIISLNKAQEDYVKRTKLLDGYVVLPNPSLNSVWNLPNDYNSFKRIDFYDVNGNSVILRHITYEIEFDKIYFYSISEEQITKLPSNIYTVVLSYYSKPSYISKVTDYFSIDDDFIIGISSRVYEDYYSKFRVDVILRGELVKVIDHTSVQYWRAKAKEYEIEGKKYRNRKDDTSSGNGQYWGVAGDLHLPKRNLVTVNKLILDGGASDTVYSLVADGGDSNTIFTIIIDGGNSENI